MDVDPESAGQDGTLSVIAAVLLVETLSLVAQRARDGLAAKLTAVGIYISGYWRIDGHKKAVAILPPWADMDIDERAGMNPVCATTLTPILTPTPAIVSEQPRIVPGQHEA